MTMIFGPCVQEDSESLPEKSISHPKETSSSKDFKNKNSTELKNDLLQTALASLEALEKNIVEHSK